MSLQSPATITLTPTGSPTPLVLVAVGDWLTELPSWEAKQGLFESDGVSLGNAFFRPLGGVVVTLQLALETDAADTATALTNLLDADDISGTSLLAISGVLTISPPSGPPVIFADAVVTAVTPDLPSGTAATLTRELTIQTTLPN
jgi:hypothetical protein